MMRSRINWTLAALLLVLVALDVATIPGKAVIREALPLFKAWPADAIQKVLVKDPGQPEGQVELELQRDAEGVFHVVNAHGYPARGRVMDLLINGIASLTTLDLLTEDQASHARYGLAKEQAVRIRFLDASDKVIADLLQGDIAPGGQASYVRRQDGDQVYRAPMFVRRVRVDALPWIDARWMGWDRSVLRKIRVHGPGALEGKEWSLLPGTRLQWVDQAGEKVSTAKVRGFQSALERITIQEVTSNVPADWATDKETISIELEQTNGDIWKGRLAPPTAGVGGDNATSADALGIANASIELDKTYQLRLAPKATTALHRAIANILK